MTAKPRVGLAVTTIGRPALAALLDSAAASDVPPVAVGIADQSGGRLDLDLEQYPFPVVVVSSTGGVSAGRNDAVAALPDDVDVVAMPNDDSTLPPTLLARVTAVFAGDSPPVALAGTYRAAGRGDLPPDGTALNRRSVWLAGEPALFVRRDAITEVGGFRTDLGTGSPSPWQSGEGTDLLLRLLARGDDVRSAQSLTVLGPGERRDLSDAEFVAKTRRYARGTGFVHRLHRYPTIALLRIVLGPWLRLVAPIRWRGLEIRLAAARSIGRVEGILGAISQGRRRTGR